MLEGGSRIPVDLLFLLFLFLLGNHHISRGRDVLAHLMFFGVVSQLLRIDADVDIRLGLFVLQSDETHGRLLTPLPGLATPWDMKVLGDLFLTAEN